MIQEDIFQEVPVERIYKPIGIYAATFFGGPLVAGYLISSNYKVLKEPNNVIKTWIFAALGTIFIVWFSNLIDYRSTRYIPGYLFPLIYSIIAYNVVNLTQKKKIAAFISSGGQFHTSGRIIVIAIVGLIITLAGLMFIANIFDFFLT